jgi:YbgC/YbaW family acyl-CoA thioester hydrolase
VAHAGAVPDDDREPPGIDWCRVSMETVADRPAVLVRDRVRLSDTDSSGLIYYGAVTSWLTRAQAELWLALGFRPEGNGPRPMMPVVNANISYLGPLRLGDPYELRVWVDEVGSTSASLGFEVRLDGELRVSARMTHVHLDVESHRPAPLPAGIVAAARSRR